MYLNVFYIFYYSYYNNVVVSKELTLIKVVYF